MLFLIILKVAIASLFANKLRTFLAMLGVIIGVGAVISMLAIGAGAQKGIMDRIAAMGTNLLVIRPGQHGVHGVTTGTQINLTLDDTTEFLKKVPDILQVAPVVQGNVQAKYLNMNSRVTVVGTAPTYFIIRNFEIGKGRNFTEAETDATMHVVILGPTTVENLFGTEDPINQIIKMNGINFKVVGVTKAKGDQGWFDPDDQAIVPYSTAMKQLFGLDYLREIDVQVKPGKDLQKVQDDITVILRKRHRLQPEAPDDFNIRNQAEILQTATDVSRTFTVLLGGIASISLLVGGIGIMNIMLVSVTERTREIGIRMAVGAKPLNILAQFLVEALSLAVMGGFIGVVLGVVGAARLAKTFGWSMLVRPDIIAIAVGFSALVGVVFGLYPARKASRLDPIEALRYE